MTEFSIDQLLSLSDDEEENVVTNQQRLLSLLNNDEDDEDSMPPTPPPTHQSSESVIPHVTSLEWADEDEEPIVEAPTASLTSLPTPSTQDTRNPSTESYSAAEQYQHTDCTSTIPAGFIFMGLVKITIEISQRAQQYILRPDIKAEAIMGLMEQVCISFGGAVTHPERDLSCLQITSLNVHQTQWSDIHIYLGANTRKQRVLLILLTPRPALYTNLDGTFADLHHTVLQALHMEKYLISYLYTTTNSSSTVAGVAGNAVATVDSVVDIHYVRDLQLAFAQELTRNIEAISHSLSSYITTTEKQCARLMTLLRPTYEMVGIEVPHPPTRKQEPPESHLMNSSLCDGSLETSKLLILRARRKYHDIVSQMPQPTAPDSELEFLLSYIFTQLRNLCETESKAIIAAKTNLAVERISAVESYQLLLLATLSERSNTTAVDESVVSKFRLSEKVLLSCKCYLYSENRYGTLYLTSNHILFDSYVVLLGTLQKVLPIYTITAITYNPATLLLSDSITIKNNSTVLATLVLTSSSPQYTERVYQFLLLLLSQKTGQQSSSVSRVSSISIQAVQKAEEKARSNSNDIDPKETVSEAPDTMNSVMTVETSAPVSRPPSAAAAHTSAPTNKPADTVLPTPTPIVPQASLPPGKSPLANSIQVTSAGCDYRSPKSICYDGDIGFLDFNKGGIPCLLSHPVSKKAKTSFTVEAISLFDGRWIGINQNRGNRYVEHFLQQGLLSPSPKKNKQPPNSLLVQREVTVNNSRLDFCCRSDGQPTHFIEVKTPLHYMNSTIHPNFDQKKLQSTSRVGDRVSKHMDTLTHLLQHATAPTACSLVLLFMHDAAPFQTPPPPDLSRLKAAHQEQIAHLRQSVRAMQEAGVRRWQLNLKVTPTQVEFEKCFELTDDWS